MATTYAAPSVRSPMMRRSSYTASMPQPSPVAAVAGTATSSAPHSPNVSTHNSAQLRAQVKIAQLQDQWNQALLSPTFRSTRLGQWVAGVSNEPPQEADPPTSTTTTTTGATMTNKKESALPPPRPDRQPSLKQWRLSNQQHARYGRAVQQIQSKVHEVAVDDAIMGQLRDELRNEGAVTNNLLMHTLHAKLLGIHKDQILQQQALAQQLQALNQANQEALLGTRQTKPRHSASSPDTVTTVVLQDLDEETMPEVPLASSPTVPEAMLSSWRARMEQA